VQQGFGTVFQRRKHHHQTRNVQEDENEMAPTQGVGDQFSVDQRPIVQN
jgi:hypothetical protein